MTNRPPFLPVFAVSLAALLLEIAYTRVFSFKLFYYFTYLVIGVAMLGLGAGAVLVALVDRLRRVPPQVLIPVSAVVAGAGTLLGYFVVARVEVNAVDLASALSRGVTDGVGRNAAALGAVIAALQVPFLAVGVTLAAAFAAHREQMGRLYAADLLGAALGCALCVPLMAALGAPATVSLAGGVLAAAGLRRSGTGLVAAVVVVAAAVLVARPQLLPDPVPDGTKTMNPRSAHHREVLFSQWNPVFRVDVMESPWDAETRVLVHDGLWGSVLHHWNGDMTQLARYARDGRQLPFALLPPGPQVAVIGAAGGGEILAALGMGARAVTGIELNPVTVSLLRERYADWTGHVTEKPGVELVNAEGRAFLRADPRHWDLVWLVAPDSYAAMNAATAGAFVLSESYLYTAEMIRDAMSRLTPDGILCTQFGEVDFAGKPNRTLRYLSTARAAFGDLGIADFAQHVVVVTTPSLGFTYATIMLSHAPFTAAQVAALRTAVAAVPGAAVQWAPDGMAPTGLVGEIVTHPADTLPAWFDAHPYTVDPVRDDRPFFWHFTRFRDAFVRFNLMRLDMEESTGERLLMILLGVSATAAGLLLLLPLLVHRRAWHDAPAKVRVGLYFAGLGFGFMAIEVALIQRLTLFLGYPTHSLTVTLFSLLLAGGLGSAASERQAQPQRAIPVALGALLVLLVATRLGLGPLLDATAGLGLGARIAIAGAIVAPFGFCLGWFVPLGVRTVSHVGGDPAAYVAWSWAVNGFCSVVSSVLATMLAMLVGFSALMAIGGLAYVIGTAALLTVRPAPAR